MDLGRVLRKKRYRAREHGYETGDLERLEQRSAQIRGYGKLLDCRVPLKANESIRPIGSLSDAGSGSDTDHPANRDSHKGSQSGRVVRAEARWCGLIKLVSINTTAGLPFQERCIAGYDGRFMAGQRRFGCAWHR